jgi:hypothetical protein
MDVRQIRWADAREAAAKLCPHDRRLLVRWCFSQPWAAHVPWECQKSTRKFAFKFFTMLMDFMAEGIETAGRAGFIVDGALFDAATHAAEKLEATHRRRLIEWSIEKFIEERDLPLARQQEIRMAATALVLNLHDMERQQEHNASGWVPVGESKPVGEKRRRPARARNGGAYPREG